MNSKLKSLGYQDDKEEIEEQLKVALETYTAPSSEERKIPLEFGQVWMHLEHLDAFGHVWRCLDALGRAWTGFGQVQIGFGRGLKQFGEVWRSLTKF